MTVIQKSKHSCNSYLPHNFPPNCITLLLTGQLVLSNPIQTTFQKSLKLLLFLSLADKVFESFVPGTPGGETIKPVCSLPDMTKHCFRY